MHSEPPTRPAINSSIAPAAGLVICIIEEASRSEWHNGLPGAYCVGCCWALMLLLFAGGVMNLTVIAALTAFVAFEKLAPFRLHGARIGGVLLIIGAFG